HCSELLRHVADEHRRTLLPACTPACCVSSHRMLLQLEPEPLSPCLETARAAGKAIGHRLYPATRLFAARSTSPRLCPALDCPARLGRSRPRLETRSASHRRPVTSHWRHRPPCPTGGQPLHRAELLLLKARATTSSSSTL